MRPRGSMQWSPLDGGHICAARASGRRTTAVAARWMFLDAGQCASVLAFGTTRPQHVRHSVCYFCSFCVLFLSLWDLSSSSHDGDNLRRFTRAAWDASALKLPIMSGARRLSPRLGQVSKAQKPRLFPGSASLDGPFLG